MWQFIRQPGVIVSALMCLILSIASATKVFEFFDDALYDLLVSASYNNQTKSNIIIIQANPQKPEFSEQQWQQFITQIQQTAPRLIAFNFIPQNAANLLAQESIVFSTDITHDYFEHEIKAIKSAQLIKNTINLNMPFDTNARVYRQANAEISFNGKNNASFIEAVSLNVLGKGIPDNSYINFTLGNDFFPHIRASRVLDNDFNVNLFTDQIVLITQGSSVASAKINSPLPQKISRSEYQAYAINSAVEDKWIKPLPFVARLALISLIIFLSLILFQWLKWAHGFSALLLLTATYGLMAWLSITYLQIRLPLADLIITQITAIIIVLFYRQAAKERKLLKLTHDIQDNSDRQQSEGAFYTSQEPWIEIIHLVNTLLELDRSIFLERVEGDHRVREIQSLNCSIKDIDEKRRDYLRPPYSNAIEAARPIPLTRNYLAATDEQDEQFIVPLIFAGNVLGFWVYSLKKGPLLTNTHNEVINSFAAQIAELLYHRHQWQDELNSKKQWWSQLFKLELRRSNEQRLQDAVRVVESRAELLKQVVNQIEAATIVYNLFGRMIQANETASRLFKDTDIKIYEDSALDFMCHLTGFSQFDMRRHLQYIILKKQSLSLPIVAPEALQNHLLKLKPLLTAKHSKMNQEQGRPFELTGIMIELLDLSSINKTNYLREDILEHFILDLRTQMSAMTMALKQIEKSEDLDRIQNKLLPIVNKQLNKSFQAAAKIQQLMPQSISAHELNIYPIDSQSVLEDVLEALQAQLQSRDIGLNCDFPSKVSLVKVDHSQFQLVLEALMQLLINDAAEHSNIEIRLAEKVDQQQRLVEYTFKSQGFGIDSEQLKRFIETEEKTLSSKMNNLKKMIKDVEDWDGKLKVSSVFGEGMSITLSLRGYSANE